MLSYGKGDFMKKPKILMVFAFLFVIGGISISSFCIKDRKFAENENRYLAQVPDISISDILDCKFQDSLEEYLKDQICFRDSWITVKTFFEKASGDTDIGGAYLGKDGYDFEKITPDDVDDKLFTRNMNNVQTYFNNCKDIVGEDNLSFLLVPTSGYVLSDKLPKNAILFNQDSYIDKVKNSMSGFNFIDARDELKSHKDEDIYYRTDHHWTTLGAYYGYTQWEKSKDCKPVSKKDMNFTKVTDKFRGSLYSKVLDGDSAYDDIYIAQNGDLDKFTVEADGKKLEGFYCEEMLDKKDKYAYFFGGNYGEVKIHNESSDKKGNLLVIKDSFANSFVPLIADDYENIYMIDLRYYGGNMLNYLKEQNIDEVLVLYNISNFVSDRNVYKLNL